MLRAASRDYATVHLFYPSILLFLVTHEFATRFSQVQKNHTGANATFKDHANGIKKAPRVKYVSLKGMDPKFLKNQR
jgi:hypothetical protein